MILDKTKKIFERISTQGEMRFLDGATEEQILSFESKNKITFPVQYREWLKYSDGGELFLPAGVQFYGVSHKPLVDINDESAPSEEYIAIGALASGDSILYKKGEEQISIYNHANGRIEEDEIYQDFYTFLMSLDELLG